MTNAMASVMKSLMAWLFHVRWCSPFWRTSSMALRLAASSGRSTSSIVSSIWLYLVRVRVRVRVGLGVRVRV